LNTLISFFIIMDEFNNIPLADDDPQVLINDEPPRKENISSVGRHNSIDSIPSSFTNGSSSPGPNSKSSFYIS